MWFCASAGSAGSPRKQWQEDEVAELMRLGEDEGYRLQVLGCRRRSWDAIGEHLGTDGKRAESKFHHHRLKQTGMI